MIVRSEVEIGGKDQITEDKKSETLPRHDMYGRPFGAVFNLHKDYSKLYVGGYPHNARIQEVVRSTNMDGQIEASDLCLFTFVKTCQLFVYNLLFTF